MNRVWKVECNTGFSADVVSGSDKKLVERPFTLSVQEFRAALYLGKFVDENTLHMRFSLRSPARLQRASDAAIRYNSQATTRLTASASRLSVVCYPDVTGLRTYLGRHLKAWRVSKDVGNVRNNWPELIEPIV